MDPITLTLLIAAGIGAFVFATRKKAHAGEPQPQPQPEPQPQPQPQPQPEPSPQPQPVSVTIDGDSIVFGVFLQHNIGARLREWRPDWTVDDRGVVGLPLHSLVSGYDEPYLDAPPADYPRGPQPPYAQVPRSTRIVVIEPGGNDALAPRAPAVWEATMREAIAIIQAEGRIVVLTGIVDFEVQGGITQMVKDQRDAYNAITLQLAAELGIEHAGWGEDYQGPGDLIDGLHRTQEASDRLAVLLMAAVERAHQ